MAIIPANTLKNITVFIILLLNASLSFANEDVIFKNDNLVKFQTINMSDGLSSNHVLDIVQDNNNYIWIATINGLNRYDGHKIRSYEFDQSSKKSIPKGVVSCLEIDNSGNLWIGTQNGLCIYDYQNDQFQPVSLIYDTLKLSHIRAILNEGDSLVWIEVLSGYLLKYDKRVKKVVNVWKHHIVWQPYYYYHDIYRDQRGVLWIATRNSSPLYLNEEENRIQSISLDRLSGHPREDDASCFYEDSYGNFWLASLEGVYNYDVFNQTLMRFLDINTFSIIQTQDKNIWFGTSAGIYRYDVDESVVVKYMSDINNQISLPNNHINKLFEDRQGIVWIGTNDGLAIYRKSNDYVKIFKHIPSNEQTAASNFVTSSVVTRNGEVWVGYANHGLDSYDPISEKIKHYRANKAKLGSLPSDKISCIYEDVYGDLYIGLWNGIGFSRKKIGQDNFELFSYNPGSRMQDWYHDFAEDEKDNFYVGLWGAKGLNLFDRKRGTFGKSLMNKFESAFESRLITKLFKDSKNELWVGTTRSGLHRYNPSKDTSVRYFDQGWLGTSFKELTIYDIIEDKSGNIWIAADSLFCYYPETSTFKVWGKNKGLTTSHVYQILEDEMGNIWLGTDKGIISFNPSWDYCLTFPDLTDIQMNEEFNTSAKLKNNHLLFGGKTGWTIFDPKKVIQKQRFPDIFLTDLYVKGELKISNLYHVSKIELDYHENFFTVSFSNTDLTAASKYSYRYRLNNLEDNWNYVEGGDYSARYTNIQPGNYTLEIQLALNNSSWQNLKMKSIEICIKSPFWSKTWFVLVAIFVSISILFIIFWSLYQRVIAKKNMYKLKELLLRAQINPHFIFNALVAIQGYIYKKEEKVAAKYLAEFSMLMRLILENTKEEYIMLDKEVQLLSYYLSLQKQRFKTQFDYEIKVDPKIDLMFIKIPPMLAQPFVENAIEHGVTKKDTEGFIQIKLEMIDGFIQYTIEDDGIGREKSMLLKQKSINHKSYGTEITEERINFFKKHYQYNISYQIEDLFDHLKKPVGTRVILKIPIDK